MSEEKIHRAEILRHFGAADSDLEGLLAYNDKVFDHTDFESGAITLPLPDEPFVSAWEAYIRESERVGIFSALQKALVQFNFPIQAGISQTENYQAATRRGKAVENMPEASGLSLNHPEKLELFLYPTLGGRIPILIVRDRADFVAITQALSLRNEPAPVPDSKGAGVLAGYNNWERLNRLKEDWMAQNPAQNNEFTWQMEMKRITPQKDLYQDKFIVLSDGNYSAVPAEALHLDSATWKNHSLVIRREHECTHYFTGRVLKSMRNNLVDELIADYAGIVAANGRYRSDWFLHFVGLENYPTYREGGRLQNYRGELTDAAFAVVKKLIKHAADNLEKFDLSLETRHLYEVVMALTYLTLEEIAAVDGVKRLGEVYQKVQTRMG